MELGCDEVYGDVPERISNLLGIKVNQSQVYRTCQNVAEAIDDIEAVGAPAAFSDALRDSTRVMYGMVDGSMLFTDDGWQETKLGRIFQAELIEKERFKWEMEPSCYVAKRGHYDGFTQDFERMMPPNSLCPKVFVTDGAAWIGQWIKDSYPAATHILDFFHVCEKLASIAPQKEPDWLEVQKDRLLNDRFDEVLHTIKNLPQAESTQVLQVIGYLENNRQKMKYGLYRQKGWMIGSGAIESAHRTVLQVRMKRSGQRWANHGCDNLIKLRVIYKNDQGHLIKKAFKKVA